MTSRFSCAVVIEGKQRLVELEDLKDDGRMRLVVDGRAREGDVRDLGGGVWSILEGTQTRLLWVDAAPGGKLTVEVSHSDGEPRLCSAEVSAKGPTSPEGGARGAAQTGPVTLRAPIPGRLVKVLVKAGDQIQAGQTLLVLEAMKMENELRSPRAGTVSAVHAAEGIAVETGQDLISLG